MQQHGGATPEYIARILQDQKKDGEMGKKKSSSYTTDSVKPDLIKLNDEIQTLKSLYTETRGKARKAERRGIKAKCNQLVSQFNNAVRFTAITKI